MSGLGQNFTWDVSNVTPEPEGTYDIEGRFRTCIRCTAIAGVIVAVGRTWIVQVHS